MTTLTFSAVLAEAVEAEAAAARFYDCLQSHTKDPDAQRLLSAMAAVQRAHCSQVAFEGCKAVNSRVLGASLDSTVPRHVAHGWEEIDELTFDEALGIALEGQLRAKEFYSGFASMFEGQEEAVLRRAGGVELHFARQLQGAMARRAVARRHAQTLAQLIANIVVARRAVSRTLGRLEANAKDDATAKFVREVAAYQEQRSDEIARLSELPLASEPRSPAFRIRGEVDGAEPLELGSVMRIALEVEEKTALYCEHGAATLRGNEAGVLKNLASESLDNAKSIAAALREVTLHDTGGSERRKSPRLAA